MPFNIYFKQDGNLIITDLHFNNAGIYSNPINNTVIISGNYCYLPVDKYLYMSDQAQTQLNIEISEEVAEGSYANLAIITHSHAEFVIDFVNVMPGTPKSKVKSRIILTPQHAKRLMKALADNIQKFEAVNGTIKDLEDVQIPMQFGGPTAQA